MKTGFLLLASLTLVACHNLSLPSLPALGHTVTLDQSLPVAVEITNIGQTSVHLDGLVSLPKARPSFALLGQRLKPGQSISTRTNQKVAEQLRQQAFTVIVMCPKDNDLRYLPAQDAATVISEQPASQQNPDQPAQTLAIHLSAC